MNHAYDYRIDTFVNDKDWKICYSHIKEPKVTTVHIDKLISYDHSGLCFQLTKNPNLTSTLINTINSGTDFSVSFSITTPPNSSSQHKKFMNDENYHIVKSLHCW
jgi:hypothetical protein